MLRRVRSDLYMDLLASVKCVEDASCVNTMTVLARLCWHQQRVHIDLQSYHGLVKLCTSVLCEEKCTCHVKR